VRILYFTRDYTPHDHRFLSALSESQHRVYFLQLEQRGHPLEDRPLPSAIEQVHWSGGQKPATLRNAPGLLLGLQKIVQQVKPHLIHAGPIQRSALLTAVSGFRPLVSMSWGYDLIQDAKRNAWWRWATRFTLKNSDWLVGDCDAIRKLAVSYGMPADRITTFPWGIDLEHFSPPTTNEAEEGPIVNQSFTLLSTRSWEPIYGVDILARAFVLAARECPDLRLIMLGNGSLAGSLRKIFMDGGMLPGSDNQAANIQSSRVIFPGQIGFDKLPHYYQSADLYLAATHSDGTSISLLEAMGCGCPVLVSDLDGNREWVTPEKNGWLFPQGDAHAMAQAILKAVKMRSQLPGMGEAARKTVEQRADWKTNFSKLLQVYQQVYDRYYNE
jgi:glycosyltransferase involved in cell wall biosynthesis